MFHKKTATELKLVEIIKAFPVTTTIKENFVVDLSFEGEIAKKEDILVTAKQLFKRASFKTEILLPAFKEEEPQEQSEQVSRPPVEFCCGGLSRLCFG